MIRLHAYCPIMGQAENKRTLTNKKVAVKTKLFFKNMRAVIDIYEIKLYN